MPISGPIVKQLVDRGVIGQVGTPTNDYGLEGSPEWNYFQQQVDDYRSGRSAYRGQRTTEGSPTFGLSDEEYKKASDKYYSGLLNKINANRIEGIGEFGLSTRIGRNDPSLINYNPNKTRAYTFGRDGKMAEIGSDRMPEYPDVDKETIYNKAAAGVDELLLNKMGVVGKLAHSVVGDKFKQDLKSKIDSGAFNMPGVRMPGGGLNKLIEMGIQSGGFRKV